jgi:hypothetical protein
MRMICESTVDFLIRYVVLCGAEFDTNLYFTEFCAAEFNPPLNRKNLASIMFGYGCARESGGRIRGLGKWNGMRFMI